MDNVIKPCLTIGNPPFGKNSNLAINFFNKAAQYSDVIAFILPKTFLKSSIINKLDLKFHKVYEMNIPEKSFTFRGIDYDVNCLFQIWIKSDSDLIKDYPIERVKIPKILTVKDFNFVNYNDNHDLIIRRNGALAGKIFKNHIHGLVKIIIIFRYVNRNKKSKKLKLIYNFLISRIVRSNMLHLVIHQFQKQNYVLCIMIFIM